MAIFDTILNALGVRRQTNNQQTNNRRDRNTTGSTVQSQAQAQTNEYARQVRERERRQQAGAEPVQQAPRQNNTQQNRQSAQQSTRQTMNPNTAQGRQNRDEIKASVNESKTNWDYINTVIDSALSHNSLTAPLMKTIKSAKEPKTVQEQAQPKDTRTVTEKVGDFITSIPKAINERKTNQSYQFGMSDEEQERIARERGASDEDIAQAKQAFAMNIDYINRNAQHGHTYEKMVENQMRTAGGLPMDSWLRFLPDNDGNIVDRSLNSARAGVLMHGQGLTGLQANIGNRLGADDYEEERLKDFQYQQALTQQALSGDNQGAYDRIFANSVSNLLTGLETTALGQLGGMSLGTHALENVGLGNMAVNSFGNAYGNVRTGGMGEQYADDVDAARRYAYASALNELGQEKMFDALSLISGGKITENTIPGANVFGLGSFMTEAAEEGAGALVDPFAEAALEGNVFSPEYWNRVGEIYKEQGLAGTMQNVRDSAIEGGLGGVMGGVMSNPYQSARQVGTDINALRADLGKEGIRNTLRQYDEAMQGGQETGDFVPNPNGYSLEGARAQKLNNGNATLSEGTTAGDDFVLEMYRNEDGTYDVYDTRTGASNTYKTAPTISQAEQDMRQAVTDEKTSVDYGDYEEALDELSNNKNIERNISTLKSLVSRGGLRSSVPSLRERAQRANEAIIRYDIKTLGVQDVEFRNGVAIYKPISEKTIKEIIDISNRNGIPVDFLPHQIVERKGAGAWFAPGPGGKFSLNTGVIHLPDRPVSNDTLIEALVHEITHTTEGSNAYNKFKEDMRENSNRYVDEDGNVTLDPVNSDTYAEDKRHMFGVETVANRSGDFANKNPGTVESYASGRNKWAWSLLNPFDANGEVTNLQTRARKARTTGLGLEAQRAGRYVKNTDQLEYDADYVLHLKNALDEKVAKWTKQFVKKNDRQPTRDEIDRYKSRAKVEEFSGAEIEGFVNSSKYGLPVNRIIPYNGEREWDTPKVKKAKSEEGYTTEFNDYASGNIHKRGETDLSDSNRSDRLPPLIPDWDDVEGLKLTKLTSEEELDERARTMLADTLERKGLQMLPGDDNIVTTEEARKLVDDLIESKGKSATLPKKIQHLQDVFFEGRNGKSPVGKDIYDTYLKLTKKDTSTAKKSSAKPKKTKATDIESDTMTEEDAHKMADALEQDYGKRITENDENDMRSLAEVEKEEAKKLPSEKDRETWNFVDKGKLSKEDKAKLDAIMASIFGNPANTATFASTLKSRFGLTREEAKTAAELMVEKGFNEDVLDELVNKKGIKKLATIEQGGELKFSPHKLIGQTYNEFAPRKIGFKPYTSEMAEAYDKKLEELQKYRGSVAEYETNMGEADKALLKNFKNNAHKYAKEGVDESKATIKKTAEGKLFVIEPDGTFSGSTVDNLYQGIMDSLRETLLGKASSFARMVQNAYGTRTDSYKGAPNGEYAKRAFETAKELYDIANDLKENGINSEYFKKSGYKVLPAETVEGLNVKSIKGESNSDRLERIAKIVDENLEKVMDISDDSSLSYEQKLEKSLALFKDKQAVEEKTEPVRKTEQDVFEEVVNKETPKKKQRKPKVEQKTVETEKTEEKKEEERKEETPKEEISEQELPPESEEPEIITRAKTAYGNGDVKGLSNYYKGLGISEDTANKLAQRIRDGGNSANLEQTAARELTQANKEEYPEVADARDVIGNINSALRDVKITETEAKKEEAPAKREINEPRTISKERQRDLDTLAFFRDQNEENAGLPSDMERVHRKADSETERPDRLRQKNRIAKSDTEVASMNAHEMMQYFHDEDWGYVSEETEKEIEDLAKETENNKVVSREEGDVYNSVAALLYRAGGKLETVNEFAKHLEETGKEGKVKQAGRRQVERELLENGEFKTIEGAGQFVDKVVNAYKKMSNTKSDESVEMTGADFNRMTAEPASGEGYEQNADMKDTLESTTISKRRVRKRDRIYEQVEENVKKVNDTAKKVKGEEFNTKDTETIKSAETRAEEAKEEKHERQQVKLEDFVAKQAEEMRQASSDRLNYAQDFSKSQTTAKFVKDKYWDEGLRARAEESHLIKAVKHDADVKADASKWNDESGQGGVVAYAEAMNRDNGYEPSEEELLYLIEGLKRANKLQQDIAQNIKRLENDNSKGAKEALSKMRDEQKYQMDACVTLFEAIKGDGSEAGRALRAMRYLYETPELIPAYMRRKIAQLNKKYAKQLKNREIKLDQDLLDKISNPNISDEERDELWDKINYNLADQLPRTLSGRVTQWRKTGMLLNPRTHIRNIISNGLTYGMFRINDLTQAGIENFVLNHKAVQKLLNTEYTEADRRAAARVDKDYMEVAEWLDKQHRYSREGGGGGKFNIFEGISEAGAFSNNNPVGRFLNKVARANNKALNTEDRWFVEGRAHRAMAEMLKAQGYKVEKKGSDFEITKDNKAIQQNVLEAIEREALKNAQEATYHDFNKAAKALENLKKSLGSAGYAIDIIVPFTKTPANIMRRSLEFSPVGLAKSVTTDLYKVRNGDMSASTYITRLSRGVTGTAAFIIGAVIANMGWLSKPDDDEDERTEYYEDNVYGKQDLALHIGDRYYSLDWAMPSSAPLMMGAAMANEFSKHGLNILDYDAKELLSDGAKALNPVLEASYLGSLSDFMTSFSQGVNYGGNVLPAGTLGGFERAGSSIVENLAGQMAPTIGGAINRTIDSTKRTTSGNTMGERVKNKFLMNTPFFSRLLQPAIDEKGNEIKNLGFISDDVIGRLIYNFATPMTITEDTHDKLDSALMSVGTNSKGVAVALPRNQTGTGGLKGQILSDLRDAGMNLSDISAEEYTQVKKTYYGNYREYAKAYNELAEYNHLGTHVRDDVYTKLEQLALAEAKATYYDKVGSVDELYTKEQKAALALKAHGVSPAQFYLIKDCGLTGNRKALYVMSELENLGVADEVIDDIMHQKYFASAVGLSDSVVLKTADEREDARAKYLMEDGETLESMVANYRAQSNEAYEAKKESDSKKSEEESWEKFFEKADKKYGTHLSSGKGSKGSGSKGKSSGGRRSSSRKSSSGGGSSSGSSSSTTISADEQEMYEKFFKAAGKALNIKGDLPSASVKVKFDDDSALWDRLVNASKSDVEKLRRELGIK